MEFIDWIFGAIPKFKQQSTLFFNSLPVNSCIICERGFTSFSSRKQKAIIISENWSKHLSYLFGDESLRTLQLPSMQRTMMTIRSNSKNYVILNNVLCISTMCMCDRHPGWLVWADHLVVGLQPRLLNTTFLGSVDYCDVPILYLLLLRFSSRLPCPCYPILHPPPASQPDAPTPTIAPAPAQGPPPT